MADAPRAVTFADPSTPTRRHAQHVSSRFLAHVQAAMQRQPSGSQARAAGRAPAEDPDGKTAQSMRAFRGEAKGILHGIFLVLLLRFLLLLLVAACALGAAAALVLAARDPGAPLASYVAFWSRA